MLATSVLNDAFALIVKGIELLKTLFSFNVISPVLTMIIPPVPVKGDIHSVLAVLAVDVLYFNVAADPYANVPEKVLAFAPFSIDKIPFMVTAVPAAMVFPAEPPNVRLLKVMFPVIV